MNVGRRLVSVFFLAVPALLPHTASAVPVVNLAIGTLPIGSTNNQFLVEFHVDGSGVETAYAAFASANGIFLTSPPTAPYSQSANPPITFDFSFNVLAPAILSENPLYAGGLPSSTSSLTLMQGSNVIDTGVQTGPLPPGQLGVGYSLAPVTLNALTQYDLVITTLGIPVTYNPGSTFTAGGQISLDISPATSSPTSVTPEPGSFTLLTTGVLASLAFARRRTRAFPRS